jgi:hypothetical protein
MNPVAAYMARNNDLRNLRELAASITFGQCPLFVMAGLVPAIHVFLAMSQDVDARHKAGHDER